MIGPMRINTTKIMKRKPSVAEECLNNILTCENSRSYFCTNINGKYEITNESVRSFVINKLYDIVSSKVAKMDVEYKEILKTKGDYKKYKYFASIEETIKQLKGMINEGEIGIDAGGAMRPIFDAHENLCKDTHVFIDAFRFDIGSVKQYYLAVISSIIYSLGYIITSLINYNTRDGKVEFKLIYKNENILNKNLPHNMYVVMQQFNDDCNSENIKATVNTYKNKKPASARESLEMYGEQVEHEDALLTIAAIIGGIIMLPSIIRYIIYFFMHSKIKLSEYLEQQALFLELNVRRLKNTGTTDKKVIAEQEAIIEKLRAFAVKLSGDKYRVEKEVDREISQEDRVIVKESDDEAKKESKGESSDDSYDDSDILL